MSVLSGLDVDMCNVHAAGTKAMMQAAIEGLTREDGTRPLLIAVTQLTSTSEEVMQQELWGHVRKAEAGNGKPGAMLLYQPFGSLVSVARFSPGHFRRRTSRPVSCGLHGRENAGMSSEIEVGIL